MMVFRRSIVLLFVLVGFLGAYPAPASFTLPPSGICDLFGYIYLEEGNRPVDYTFYVEESEFSADLVVFWEENRLYADASGHWHETQDSFEAHHILKQVSSPNKADFIVYFTEYEHRAGCP
ncbi:MAG TPA: hypothetical protein DCE41_00200 [Cytophagales bacterium]|nr:hypothetical protein [Cytophagales bacterium]HAA20374.1 hypothetical protein [Cytophagales bacterium]HAP60874.1 hypothetical protein [Cytophagales bacterium]